MARTQRPWGAVLSGVAAAVFATPTLVFPADSPTEPKLGFLAVGALIFAGAVVRIRAEDHGADATPPGEVVTED